MSMPHCTCSNQADMDVIASHHYLKRNQCHTAATVVVGMAIYKCMQIIESVDSICRDRADPQYMLTQTNSSKSPKQQTYKPL